MKKRKDNTDAKQREIAWDILQDLTHCSYQCSGQVSIMYMRLNVAPSHEDQQQHRQNMCMIEAGLSAAQTLENQDFLNTAVTTRNLSALTDKASQLARGFDACASSTCLLMSAASITSEERNELSELASACVTSRILLDGPPPNTTKALLKQNGLDVDALIAREQLDEEYSFVQRIQGNHSSHRAN